MTPTKAFQFCPKPTSEGSRCVTVNAGPCGHPGRLKIMITAAIRKIFADDRIVVADERGEEANRENDRQRAIPQRFVLACGGQHWIHKSRSDDVSLAGAPVAVEQGSRPLPVHVSRTMNADA